MKTAKPHRITAAVFDLSIAGAIGQMVGAWIIVLTATSLAPAIPALLAVVCIVGVIMFHTLWAQRVALCSPGEHMTGCRLVESEKQWFSSYARSRWFLFLTLFALLYGPRTVFQIMQRSGDYPLQPVVISSIYVCLMLWALYKIASGAFVWALAPYGYLALGMLHARTLASGYAEVVLWVFGVQAALLTITLLVYRDGRVLPDESAAAGLDPGAGSDGWLSTNIFGGFDDVIPKSRSRRAGRLLP